MEVRDFTWASFNKFLEEKRLMGSQCEKCRVLYLPPRPLCTHCYSKALQWVELEGEGKLMAFTVIAVGPTFMVEQGYNRSRHYCSGIVQLKEGPQISARILGVDVSKPETIKIGTPLQVEFLTRGEGAEKRTFLAFKAL